MPQTTPRYTITERRILADGRIDRRRTATYYVTRGEVRGECGHRHRTVSTALACIADDAAGCRRQGGYSDRGVYRVSPDEPRGTYIDIEDEE